VSGACAVAGAASSAVGSAVGFTAGSVLDALGSWVSDGAAWLLGQIGGVLNASTSVDLGAPWFSAHYATMAALAGVVVVPLLLLGILQAIYRQNAAMLLRSTLVNVPLAVLLTAVAVTLVQLGLTVTDWMCGVVANGAGLDTVHFMAPVTAALAGATIANGGVPPFVVLLGALAVVAGAVTVWIELLLRAAAVYVAVLFLPLALASLAWPAIAHWSRRLVDTLVALVLSKLVIVAVLSLAVGALAGGEGWTPAGGTGASASFASVLGGAALLLLAAFAPWSLFRLLPFIEAGAVGHLEGLSQRARHQVAAPVRGLAQMALRAKMGDLTSGSTSKGGGGGHGSVGVVGPVAGDDSGTEGAGGSGGPGLGGGGSGGSLEGEDFYDPYRPDDWTGPQPWEPGGTITMMPPTPRSSESVRRMAETQSRSVPQLEAGRQAATGGAGGPDMTESPRPSTPGDVPVMPPGVTYVATLPRATGARHADHLGRDHLGPVLVAGNRPAARPVDGGDR
jgi:hypothetical protein